MKAFIRLTCSSTSNYTPHLKFNAHYGIKLRYIFSLLSQSPRQCFHNRLHRPLVMQTADQSYSSHL